LYTDLQLWKPKDKEDINIVHNWGVDNDFGFNVKTCHFLGLTTTKSTQEFVYTINGGKLERVESIKDLDAIINYNMSFHVHITNVVNEAYKRLGSVMTKLETPKWYVCS
jgi:hypothetical protein